MEEITRHLRRSVRRERALLSVTDAQGVCRRCRSNALTGAKLHSHRLQNRTTAPSPLALEGDGSSYASGGNDIILKIVLDTSGTPSYISSVPPGRGARS